jgi:hypothetical protein
MDGQQYKYFAFISYKRGGVDGDVANWIHTKLEKYPYPAENVLEDNRPNDNKFIRDVFIDVKNLHVSDTDFSDDIKDAIEKSRYLIVVCSKRAALSSYINDEVSYFLQTHNNDSGKILPVFIDTVEDGLPMSIRNVNMLSRHCPVYNTLTDEKDEVNLYCFYHIVSFLLKVDFNYIYDRYKSYTKRKQKVIRRLKYLFYGIISLMIVFMINFIVAQNRLIDKQKELVELEKEIFPYSVVTGYVGNFASPVISYIKQNEPEAHLYVHMPLDEGDIDDNHKKRFKEISANISKQLSLDSISSVHLKTSMPRGSNVHKLFSSKNESLNHKYIDFASTTSTFLAIAQKKKEKNVYKGVAIDDMIKEYTRIFIKQANELLQADSVYITFVTEFSEIK